MIRVYVDLARRGQTIEYECASYPVLSDGVLRLVTLDGIITNLPLHAIEAWSEERVEELELPGPESA